MDFNGNLPIYLQIVNIIKDKIASGQLKSGDKFPSVRDLASEYKVNPNTVQRSTQILESEGIIYSKRGIGSFIIDDDNLLKRLKDNKSKIATKTFVASMINLGYDREEILNLVKEAFDEYYNIRN